MSIYLITGASRGIGLELTKQLLSLPASKVEKIFTVTRGSPPDALQGLLKEAGDRVVHVTASVDDAESVQKAAQEVKAKLGDRGLDVLINNAGVGSYSPEGTITMTPEDLAKVLDVNVVGPQRVISAFLPLLEAGKQKTVINMSSPLGSVALVKEYAFAPTPAYKISKSALNMLNAQYAIDYAQKGFTFLCVSPGWLKTDMGSEAADLEVEVGVEALKKVILEAGPEQNGKFMDIYVQGHDRYPGGEIPW